MAVVRFRRMVRAASTPKLFSVQASSVTGANGLGLHRTLMFVRPDAPTAAHGHRPHPRPLRQHPVPRQAAGGRHRQAAHPARRRTPCSTARPSTASSWPPTTHRIHDAVLAFGGESVMTGEHENGTARLAEAAVDARPRRRRPGRQRAGRRARDCPRKPSTPWSAASPDDVGADMATLAAVFGPGEDTTDPNVVKLVLTPSSRALYFSRSPIPHDRDGDSAPAPAFTRRLQTSRPLRLPQAFSRPLRHARAHPAGRGRKTRTTPRAGARLSDRRHPRRRPPPGHRHPRPVRRLRRPMAGGDGSVIVRGRERSQSRTLPPPHDHATCTPATRPAAAPRHSPK